MLLRKKSIKIKTLGECCYWTCKCGKQIEDDRNFCMYCDRERPIRNREI